MSVRRIKEYPLMVLNGVNKLTVPGDSIVVGVGGLQSTNEIVHAFVEEPYYKLDEESPPPSETIKLLVLNARTPFSEPEGNEVLFYVGTVVWDNGHRMSHVYEILPMQELLEMGSILAEEPMLIPKEEQLVSN